MNDPFVALNALGHGVQDYLVKPASEQRILHTVKTALARHQFHSLTKDDPAYAGNLDRIILEARLGEIPRAQTWLYRKLEPLKIPARDRIFIHAAYEFLMNAYEHGCLGLGEAEKNRLLGEEGYQDELRRREEASRGGRIALSISILRDKIAITIEDDGPGFDHERYQRINNAELAERMARACGRGIALASRQFDSVTYGNGGNRVTLVKRLSLPVAD